MKMPQTREEVLKIIETCFCHRFKDDPKCDYLVNDYMKREIDINFSKGYKKDAYTEVTFCVKGSPNKMTGFITKGGVACQKCEQFTVIAMRVVTDWGVFHLLNGRVYYHGSSVSTRDFRSCKQHK